jgi:vacuolar protein sorting-associated protein 52
VTVTDSPDPLEVLERLLGSEGNQATGVSKGAANGENAADEDFELELDFEDLTLRNFASGQSLSSRKEHVYATQTVEECRFF